MSAVSSGNLRGIAALSVAMICLTINDVTVKLTSSGMPTGQLIFLRGLAACVFTLVLCVVMDKHRRLAEAVTPHVLARAFANLLGTVTYLTALFNMPIANVSAIVQAIPLVLTAMAALFLKEKVGIRRWSAIVVGMIGVLFIVRPTTDAFNIFAMSALATVLLIAVRDLLTRIAHTDIPSIVITFATTAVVTLGAGMLSFFEDWVRVDFEQATYITVAAVFLVLGIQLVIVALRAGAVAVVAPFRFSIVLWATLAGYFIWGEIPDRWSIVGTALIVSAAIYTLWRERVAARSGTAIIRPPHT